MSDNQNSKSVDLFFEACKCRRQIPSEKNKSIDFEANNLIFGKNSICEALKSGKRNINKIIISKNSVSDAKLNEIINLAKSQKVVFQFIPKEKFHKYSEHTHQGIVAFVSPVEYTDLDDFLSEKNKAFSGENSKVMVLDGVQDPHNFGSIIRTCVCAGFDAIIISHRKNSPVNATVEKTSAGAVNHIPVISVNSLGSAVEKLKNNDYWIIATDAKGKDNYFDTDYTGMNLALVLGGEESGVSKTIINNSDFTVKIPMFNEFNSLNVSNAAAVIVYEIIRQTIQKPKNKV